MNIYKINVDTAKEQEIKNILLKLIKNMFDYYFDLKF